MIRLSVVIPIYNAEDFLDECLRSVERECRSDARIETVMIDDGSSDRSAEIAQRYAEKLPAQMRLIRQANGGQSVATNYGIRMVRGDCVGFVDADDWIDPGMLTGMLDAMIASDAEMVICDYRKVFADGSTKVFRYQQTGTAGLDPHDDPRLIFGCGYSPWNKVVRKRMFEEHGCYFPEGMIFQDMVAFVRMISRSRKVVNTGAVAYNYRIREGSLLHSMNPSAYDIFKALELLQQTLDRRFEAELEFLAMKELFYASMPRVVRYGGSDARRFFERSVTFLEERFPGWRQNRYLKERGWWHRWYMFGIGKRCYRCVRVLALLKKIGRY